MSCGSPTPKPDRSFPGRDNVAVGLTGIDRRAGEIALRPWTPVFTHGDLQVAHVFVRDDEVTGIVDWSDACRGDALAMPQIAGTGTGSLPSGTTTATTQLFLPLTYSA